MQISRDKLAEKLIVLNNKASTKGTVYPKSGGAFYGEGELRRDESDFSLKLTFPPNGEAPAADLQIYTQDDFWRFEGESEGIHIKIEGLCPIGVRSVSNGITSQEYTAHAISFTPTDSDKMTIQDLHRLSGAPESETVSESEKPSPFAKGVWIHARILNFPLIHFNGGTNIAEKMTS